MNKRIRQFCPISMRNKNAGLAVDASLARSVDVVRNGNHAAEQRLRHGAWQTFARTRMGEQVHRAHQSGNLRWRNKSGQHDHRIFTVLVRLAKRYARLTSTIEQMFSLVSIADPQQSDTGIRSQHLRQTIQEIIVPLVFGEPCHGSDHDVFRLKSQSRANRFA